jgi:hypothetical protein
MKNVDFQISATGCVGLKDAMIFEINERDAFDPNHRS